jgi:hypothetical protein
MNDTTLKALADQAIRFAVNGSSDFLHSRGIDARQHVDALLPLLREEAGRAAAKALLDVREAVAANMHAVAEATFAASMKLAGIAAARRLIAQMEVPS